MKKERKKLFLIATGVVGALFLFLGVWAFVIEPDRLVVHEETIALTHWPSALSGLRIAAIADIHAGSPFIDEEKLRLVVERANATNPDVIVLLGDY
ncbi:MAG: metallophosphoesterase, partial [Pyrinomonadaceae bacterium]